MPAESAELSAPFFVLEATELRASVAEFRVAFPDAEVLYALKANPHPAILGTLAGEGCGFEAASWFEIEQVLALGVLPERITFGTAVKSRSHVERAWAVGVSRFAADSREELFMLADAAPGSSVFVRAKLDDQHSVFRMNEKFGAPVTELASLFVLARKLGLHPWGVSLNVGSQASRADQWALGIACLAPVIHDLLSEGITLEAFNLGGGFPVAYRGGADIPLSQIARLASASLGSLPYQPRLVVEPGRRLVAKSMRLVSSIEARIERTDGPWLFLDCGVYNALYEALLHQGRTAYPVSALGPHDADTPTARFTLAGPTGDGLDVIARDVALPADLGVGDRLLFEHVGAYTHCMASTFNGFPIPPVRVVS